MPAPFSDDFIERVRAASDLVDVAGEVVKLKRAGGNFRGLSPFASERTPSFYVLPEKQCFKCFSSGHGGDVFKFVMLRDNVDFLEAVTKLAKRAGVQP